MPQFGLSNDIGKTNPEMDENFKFHIPDPKFSTVFILVITDNDVMYHYTFPSKSVEASLFVRCIFAMSISQAWTWYTVTT